MPASESDAPRLRVRSEPLGEAPELIDFVTARDPLVWVRGGSGFAAQGVAHRIVTGGADRFASASAAWRHLVERADIDDRAALPGSGLVAFGSFAFAAASAEPSVLVVPRQIVGIRDGAAWSTRIWREDEPEPGPAVRTDGTAFGAAPVRFSDGEQTPDGYVEAVARAIGAIGGGDVAKVVLARDIRGRLGRDADLRPVLLGLAEGYPKCWTFSVDGLVGSSPETLITVRDGRATARVLAGTASRGADRQSDQAAAEALASSVKDQDEHAFAVENVVASLRPHVAALTRSEVPFTLKLPNVWHLATDVEATVGDGSDALALVEALHPTAAVAGTPSAEAVRLIARLEPFDRGRYSGPVGWIDASGDGEWAIALRCAAISADGDIRAYAGCGIVADSDPAHELVETRMKFRPIVEAFA